MEINEFEILSVGVDIGSSTSHLAFSKLTLKRDECSITRRFDIRERKVVYEGHIIDTPFLEDDTIDIDQLTAFLRNEYQRAGIDPAEVRTGAVIVTGESAKRQNARQIAEALSTDAGKFVAATAGPNFESLVAALGSGAAARSKAAGETVVSCDIGGGTANLAVSKNGEVEATSCIAVGGRLIGIDSDGIIRHIHEPALKVMKHLGLNYGIGDPIATEDTHRIAAALAEVLFEVLTGPASSPLARELMVTSDLEFAGGIDAYAFSGGVAELMYGCNGRHNDIGPILAIELNRVAAQLPAPVIELPNKIRATVIGAGAYSVSISGCSGFSDDQLVFPIRNVPVIRVDIDRERLSMEQVKSRISAAFRRFDLNEGDELAALYFQDPVRASYPQLELFAKSLENVLVRTVENNLPVILIFETDIACSVGNVLRRETQIKTHLLALDELTLKEGDWIDIGEPLVAGQVFPVTVKSLVFH